MKKIFKKTIATLLATTTMAVGISNLNLSALSENAIDYTSYQFATDFLSEYYNAIDQYETYNFKNYVDSTNMLTYINEKVKSKQYKSVVYGLDDMQNYELTFSLKSEESLDDDIKLTILVEAEFNYKDSKINSAYGEVNQLIISDNDGYHIEDWYIASDFYDAQIRGDMLNIKNPNYWDATAKQCESTELLQEELNNNIKQFYDDLKIQSELSADISSYVTNKPNASVSSRKSLYSLNRSNMVTWANTNCSKDDPSSGNTSQVSSYYDFSSISGSYDCTNFVSHALLAGGAVVYDTGNTGISSTGWYFRNISNRSSSWSGVANLYNFLTTNTTKGPTGSYLAYSSIYAPSGNFPYQAGDILQFHNGSIWRHSTLITGYTNISGSSTTLEAIVTGRSSDGSYNKNQKQSTIYTGYDRRVIKMAGYYN